MRRSHWMKCRSARVPNAGVALADQPPRPLPAGFAADALRQAAVIAAERKDLALPKDKAWQLDACQCPAPRHGRTLRRIGLISLFDMTVLPRSTW